MINNILNAMFMSLKHLAIFKIAARINKLNFALLNLENRLENCCCLINEAQH